MIILHKHGTEHVRHKCLSHNMYFRLVVPHYSFKKKEIEFLSFGCMHTQYNCSVLSRAYFVELNDSITHPVCVWVRVKGFSYNN